MSGLHMIPPYIDHAVTMCFLGPDAQLFYTEVNLERYAMDLFQILPAS